MCKFTTLNLLRNKTKGIKTLFNLLLSADLESIIVLWFVESDFLSILVFAIILMGRGRELAALLSFPFWCLVIVVWLFLAVTWGCLQFMLFPDHTHLLLLVYEQYCLLWSHKKTNKKHR